MATATWNAADAGSGWTLSNDLTWGRNDNASNWRSIRATEPVLASQVRRFRLIGGHTETGIVIGFGNASAGLSLNLGADANGWGWLTNATGQSLHNGVNEASAGGLLYEDKGEIEYDGPAGEIKLIKNDTVIHTFTSVTGNLYPMFSARNGLQAAFDFVDIGKPDATITFASGAITDAAGNAVTESGVIASVCDRATGLQLATTTANVSGGAATLNITADVTNGQAVVVHFHSATGTFKVGGFLATVVV